MCGQYADKAAAQVLTEAVDRSQAKRQVLRGRVGCRSTGCELYHGGSVGRGSIDAACFPDARARDKQRHEPKHT